LLVASAGGSRTDGAAVFPAYNLADGLTSGTIVPLVDGSIAEAITTALGAAASARDLPGVFDLKPAFPPTYNHVALSLPGTNASGGAATFSGDGTTLVGFADRGFFTPFHAFRWTQATGTVDLGTLDPANNATRSSFAWDVSRDGAVVTGFSDVGTGFVQHAFRWTAASGMVGLGSFMGATGSSRGFGISADGNVIVGDTDVPNNFGGATRQAFRWTSASGFQRLGALEGEFNSIANAISDDGNVIVGMAGLSLRIGNTLTNGLHAFRWTQAGGMQDLGVLPGHQYSAATMVSADGSIVVGVSSSALIDRNGVGSRLRYSANPDVSRAFYWTAQTGMRDLNQMLTAASADLAGGVIVAATGLSSDGRWIGGAIFNPAAANSSRPVLASLTETAPPPPAASRLLNLSTRALCQTGDNVLIPGFVVSGTMTKRLLIRAVGPKLTSFGVPGVLPDPQFVVKRLVNSAYVDVATNDNWGTNANAQAIITISNALGAFALDNGSRDAALILDAPPGQYTVVASGVGSTTGIAIVELYDGDDTGGGSRLSNIANRGFVGTGDDVMVMGYVISAGAPKRLLIRAVGPTLSTFGVSGTLADPRLVVFRQDGGTGTPIATNDDWGLDPAATTTATIAAQVSAFALPAGSKDAAIVLTLPPGAYTVQGSGATGGTGVALLEIYEVP